MKFNIFENSVEGFGLDISGGSIKFVQCKKVGGHRKMHCYGSMALPKGVISNDTILDPDGLSKLLVRALDKPQFGHTTTNFVNLSLSEAKSFVRIIHIPHMNEQEADAAVKFEAEAYIPLPIDQVYLDWQPTGQVADNRMEVLIIASPKEYVDKYIVTLEKAHLKPLALEVESQSISRLFIPDTSEETVLIVDIGDTRTNLIMVSKGVLQFTSSIPIAGKTFTESVGKFMGITTVQAEKIKREVGIANTVENPNLKVALLPILSNLSAEIKNVLKFQNEHSPVPVTQLLLCGGSSKLKNLVEFLTAEFADTPNIKIVQGDPWQAWKGVIDPGPLSASDAIDYGTALGLSLR